MVADGMQGLGRGEGREEGRGVARVMVFNGVNAALGMAAERPGVKIDVFEATWRDVDRGREVVEARGLGGRVHVWHVSAAELARRVIGG